MTNGGGEGGYCKVCMELRGAIEYVYHGKHGALYCARGHKLSGKNNDLHIGKKNTGGI